VDSAPPAFDAESFLETLGGDPGVYRMLDARGRVLYVGKARNLRRRVASYFRAGEGLSPKTRALMSHTTSVQVTATHTETEALLLENNLIKEHRPRYNILLRDDKSFPYIHLTTGQDFPRLAFHRGPRKAPGRYFGPFASAGATRETLNLLQKLFRVRQCEDSFYRNRSRPCLQHQIDRCTAPCVGYVDEARYAEDVRHATMFLEGRSEQMIGELVERMETAAAALDFERAARYRDQIQSLRRVQERQYVTGDGGDVDVVAALGREGLGVVELLVIRDGQSLGSRTLVARQAAEAGNAEILAAFLPQYYLPRARQGDLPDEILLASPVGDAGLIEEALAHSAGRRIRLRDRVRGERARWVEMARNNAELALARRIAERTTLEERFQALRKALDLPESSRRLECYDVSHTGGEATVAACVVLEPEGAVKSDYRRFNIEGVDPGDDYGAMREVLRRRFGRLQREQAKMPDLLIVDGGRGQLGEATRVLAELGVEGVPILGVAKGSSRRPGLEQLFLADRPAPLVLDPGSPALHLVQQIRDEAHRFAISGHRQRRARRRGRSPLEDIPGVGVKRRQLLLRAFGGLQGLARAGVEDLARVQGISPTLARAIYESFREHA
jgi:excinuclease ABC subunit C